MIRWPALWSCRRTKWVPMVNPKMHRAKSVTAPKPWIISREKSSRPWGPTKIPAAILPTKPGSFSFWARAPKVNPHTSKTPSARAGSRQSRVRQTWRHGSKSGLR